MRSALILASASPRRRELLAQAGYRFEVQPSTVAESRRPEEDAIRFATRLAREKAEEVFARCSAPEAIVLGADTVVVCDGEVMGKPLDAAEATRMLLLLSGRTHHVVDWRGRGLGKGRNGSSRGADPRHHAHAFAPGSRRLCCHR